MQNMVCLLVSGNSSHATPEFHIFSWMKLRGFSDFAPDQASKLLRAAKSFSGRDTHLVLKSEVQAPVLIQRGRNWTVFSYIASDSTEHRKESQILLEIPPWKTGYYSNESFHRANHFRLSNHHFLSI